MNRMKMKIKMRIGWRGGKKERRGTELSSYYSSAGAGAGQAGIEKVQKMQVQVQLCSTVAFG